MHLQQEQVKLGGLIMQMNSEPNNLSLKTEAVENAGSTEPHDSILNLFRQGSFGDRVIIEGQTYVCPFPGSVSGLTFFTHDTVQQRIKIHVELFFVVDTISC